MLRLVAQCLVAYTFARLSWRILRRLVVKTDLDNIPGPASQSFLKGNFSQVFHIYAWDFHKHLRQKYGAVVRINALLGEKQLYVSDPKALHHIVIEDQDIFEEADAFIAFTGLLFGKGLFATLGTQHRKQRKLLNPAFSVPHLREMVPIFYDISRRLGNTLESKLSNGPKEIDVAHWTTRIALEVIALGGLGYSIDSLQDDEDLHPYSTAAKQLHPVMFTMIFIRTYFLSTLVKLGPPRFRRFLVDLLPFENARRLRDIIDVLDNTAKEIIKVKTRAIQEGATEHQVGQGKDIITILLKENMKAAEEDKLPPEEVLGQVSTFIFAAMDPISNALSRILNVLASHQEVQEKLRQEILEAFSKNGQEELSHDELIALPLLEAVCRETLRLFPPIPQNIRTSRKDVVLPLFTPITGVDGRTMHNIIVPKDTNVIISILNSNCDPALWGPDSYEWKPERWLSPLPETIKKAPVPSIYAHQMTFLGGQRACIGFKFAQLGIKVVLSILLSKFKFEMSDKEILWEMSDLSVPTVKGKEGIRQLPLKMTSL